MKGNIMMILIAIDELYYITLFDPIRLDLCAFLVLEKKNTIFDPIKVPLLSEKCELILVYSGNSRRVTIYKNHIISLMITNTPKI
jgi:hypothetical protein